MHNEVRVSQDIRKKPHPFVYYDHTKGGVNVVDLVSATHSTRFRTRRWHMNALAFILDTVRTNSRTIYREVNSVDISNFQYTYQLGKALVLPAVQKRYENSNSLSTKLLDKMKGVLGLNLNVKRVVAQNTNPSNAPKRCSECLRDISGPGYKEAKKKLNTKLKTICRLCERAVCAKHFKVTCNPCHRNHRNSFFHYFLLLCSGQTYTPVRLL